MLVIKNYEENVKLKEIYYYYFLLKFVLDIDFNVKYIMV